MTEYEPSGNIRILVLSGGFLYGKPWREEYHGEIYHVIVRGNNK
ncbi:MAG: hypothetical protein ACOZCL_19570 [Bacillota bacterium]